METIFAHFPNSFRSIACTTILTQFTSSSSFIFIVVHVHVVVRPCDVLCADAVSTKRITAQNDRRSERERKGREKSIFCSHKFGTIVSAYLSLSFSLSRMCVFSFQFTMNRELGFRLPLFLSSYWLFIHSLRIFFVFSYLFVVYVVVLRFRSGFSYFD